VTYSTLMVHLELGYSNAAVLQVAGDLAARFDAAVIGIAACQPMQILYGDSYVSGDLIDQDREEIEKELKEAEAEFRNVLQPRVETLEWRSTVMLASLSDYLAQEGRGADLLITKVDPPGSIFDTSKRIDTADLVMRIGRPVLVVPTAAATPKFERVVVGWKDTRETRRAVFDALPLLKKATHVAVVEIAAKEELAAAHAHLKDVVAWLKRHGVMAEAIATPSTGDDTTRLNAIVAEQNADVLVAGAYGHNRLREWVLGGVTRDLLLRSARCAFVSH
jgi:nucleotide-binding universal stress UspA family protein